MHVRTPNDAGGRSAGTTGNDRPRFLARLEGRPGASRPERPANAAGEPRRVGVEIELAGLTLEAAAEAVVGVAGGTIRIATEYEWSIESSSLGTLRLEIDDRKLLELGRKKEREGLGPVDASTEGILSALAGRVTPLELVTPPLPIDALGTVERIASALGAVGGLGTRDGMLLALGTHFNPELPSEEPADLLAHLRAFVLLFDWLREEIDVDWTRRALPYVAPFPARYVEHLLRRRPPITLAELIDEYLADNPTRNRALDMLPAFDHLDSDRVRAVVDDPRIKARPTFHYRLSNACVGEEGWSVLRAWRRWLVVEDLARDTRRLEELAEARAKDGPDRWVERTVELLR